MASPAPTGAVSAPTPPSGPRWARSGEPGSAFNGLTRPGRGGGGGRGRGGSSSRGARGPTRGGPPARDAKPQDSPKAAHTPIKSHSPDKPATSSTPTKPKPPSSRRNSRTIPPAVVTQLSTTDIPPSPLSARSSSSRRRRSQAGKTTASIPSRINPPAPNDNLLRPNKPILPTVPHTAPVKDTPPHLLAQKPYIRNDIDALVERVRASAMDHHRPSTPGASSHIDWAGDDDDSLPDLDDWGVNPATFSASKSEIISPIIVDGLKHLPDLASHSYQSSPLREHREVSPEATEESHVHDTISTPVVASSPAVKEQVITVKEVVEPKPSIYSASLQASSWRPLHPSLPAKPVTSLHTAPKSSAGATPMRNASFPKSPNGVTTPSKASKFASAMEQAHVPESLQAETATTEETTEIVIAEQPIPEEESVGDDGVAEESSAVEVVLVKAAPEEVPEHAQSHTAKDPMENFQVVEGLSASIHAPKAGSDSASAPPHISTYAESNSNMRGSPTHTRAHTVGRPPSFPRSHHPDHPSRSSRSGHSTPRGGFQQNNAHSRTHSNPPPGAAHRSTGSRPVLSGAALSRLAKTIGGSNVSPGKQTVATLGD